MSIAKSDVKPNMSLVAKYKGKDFTCETFEKGGRTMFRLVDGTEYKFLSGAAGAITGIPTTNGFSFWSPTSGEVAAKPRRKSKQGSDNPRLETQTSKPNKRIRFRKPNEIKGTTQEEIDEVDRFLRANGGYEKTTLDSSDGERVFKYENGVDCGVCGAEFPDTIEATKHFMRKH